MIKVLFVCMGNICRSPAAEGVMRDKLTQAGKSEGEDFIIDSAGTTGYHKGSSPDGRSQEVTARNGIDISKQVSRPLVAEDGETFDIIVCMDKANEAGVRQIIDSKNYDKVRMLDTQEVEDPYYRSDGFERMYEHIDGAVESLVAELIKK